MNIDMSLFRTRLVVLTGQLTGRKLDSSSLARPVAELGLDSLMALELAVYLEREFSFRLTEEEIASVKALSDIVRFAETREKR